MNPEDVIFVAFGICAVIGIGITLQGWRASRRDRRQGSRQRH